MEIMRNKYREEHEDGSYVVKKSRRSNILAFIVCVLIAFCIWAIAESAKARKPAQDGSDDGSQMACVTTADPDFAQ